MPDPVRGPSAARQLPDHEPAPASRRTPPRPPPSAPASFDDDLAAFAANARPANDDVLYVGVNEESRTVEANALRAVARVHAIETSDEESFVRFEGESFDVREPEQREGFVAALGLPPATASKVADVLARASSERNVLARIAVVWAEAERGKSIPTRLVLSGHSTGSAVFAVDASVTFADVRALAKAMPRAAAQIEDLHFSACYTGGNANDAATREPWLEAFPNLETIWAYGMSSPLAPVDHLRSWAVMTRGRTERLVPNAPGVDAWSRAAGVKSTLASFRELSEAKERADVNYESLVSGRIVTPDPQSRPAAWDYGVYRRLSRHPQASPALRRECTERADKLLRIRYYEVAVRGNFAAAHRRAIEDGHRSLGLPTPDFARLSRREALEAIDRFDAALARHPSSPQEARALARVLEGLRTLDPNAIPETWAAH